MEGLPQNSQSIFDIIEERREKPAVFDWSEDAANFAYTKEEFLMEGHLGVPHIPSIFKKHVLTLKALIQYEGNIPRSALPLMNPRVERMGKEGCGFMIIGYKGSYGFLCKDKEELDKWMGQLSRVCIQKGISSNYDFGKMLGKGSFAKVYLAQSKETDKKYAVKTIDKSKILISRRSLASMERELEIMRRINHPSVMKLHEVYENNLSLQMVLEYLPGGELLKRLKSKGLYSEKEAAEAMRGVLEALEYCHSRGIIHRDLKPENLILLDTSVKAEVKIADFGLAVISKPGVSERLRCGSPGFVAPEVLNDLGYNTQVDMFSLGIVFCIILTGVSPFYGTTYEDVILKNKEGVVSFGESYWSKVSEEGKSLVKMMVARNPKERITAAQALKHPWFNLENGEKYILATALENMMKYHNKENAYRFDVSKIKPEFSMVTCTPLFNSRIGCSGVDSPLILSREGSRCSSPVPSPIPSIKEGKRDLIDALGVKKMRQPKKLSSFNYAYFLQEQKKNEEDASNFDESEIDEKKGNEQVTREIRTHAPEGGVGEKKSRSYLKSFATPLRNRRKMPGNPAPNSYFNRPKEQNHPEEDSKHHEVLRLQSQKQVSVIMEVSNSSGTDTITAHGQSNSGIGKSPEESKDHSQAEDLYVDKTKSLILSEKCTVPSRKSVVPTHPSPT